MNEPLKTLATFIFSLRAYMTKARLESEGIEVFLMNENFRYGAHVNIEEGIQLKVKESDYPRAFKILQEISPNFLQGKEERRPKVEKILVPVDFSPVSFKSCLFAIDLAKRFNASITMFHVYYLPSIDAVLVNESALYNLSISEQMNNIQKNAERKMNDLIEAINLQGDKGVKVNFQFAKGFPDDEILSFVDKNRPDLIIMGNSARLGKSKKLYGSITSEVTENVKIPVIVIPDGHEGTSPEKIHRVAYVSNFDKSDIRPVHKLLYLLSPFKVHLELIHLSERGSGLSTEEEYNRLIKVIEQEFKGANFHLTIISGRDTLLQLQEFIYEHGVDLLSIQAQKRSFFSRLFRTTLSDKLLFNSKIPFLIYH